MINLHNVSQKLALNIAHRTVGWRSPQPKSRDQAAVLKATTGNLANRTTVFPLFSLSCDPKIVPGDFKTILS